MNTWLAAARPSPCARASLTWTSERCTGTARRSGCWKRTPGPSPRLSPCGDARGQPRGWITPAGTTRTARRQLYGTTTPPPGGPEEPSIMQTATTPSQPSTDHGRWTREQIERRVRELGNWFHNLDLLGVKTAPDHFLGDYPMLKWRNFASSIPRDLHGKTVLDIGCNAGLYSLEM